MAEAETSTTETTETTTAPVAPTTDTVATADTSTILGGDAAEGASAETSTTEGGDQSAAAEPVIPEAYELTPPEGFALDPNLVTEVTPILKEAKLSNEQAQLLMPAAAKIAESLKRAGEQQLLSHVMAERAAWAAEAKADPELGGAKWDETVAMSARALDALPENVSKPLRSLLNDSGLGNKREMIAAMAFFGRAIGEDSTVAGDKIDQTTVPIAHQIFPNNVRKGQ